MASPRRGWARQNTLDLDRALYALEKFATAVRTLAVGPGDVRSRLLSASLGFHTVRPEDLPAGLRRDFCWIERVLTRSAARWEGEGRIQASLAQMQNRTGAKIARRIVELEEALRRRCADASTSEVRSVCFSNSRLQRPAPRVARRRRRTSRFT